MANKSILLIISGSIAAYKSLELIRRLRERDFVVNTILTKGGEQFVTPLSIVSLSGTPVYSELFSLKEETEMGHIRLSRESDLIIVAPASADIIAKMASGRADDLATTTLLATDKPVFIAPAMNSKMWEHKATQRNLAQLTKDGVTLINPGAGSLACGEVGAGRMAEPDDILAAIVHFFNGAQPLKGIKALVTSGPTYEAIDPVRFLGNRSSGKQGHAIAQALAKLGAEVTLVSGPTALPAPKDAHTLLVESAEEMLEACEKTLPVDVAVFAAAVSDWKSENISPRKLKKRTNDSAPELKLAQTPDILARISQHKTKRPALVIGFAAETEQLQKNATEKRKKKKCDWIVANDVSDHKVFGQDTNNVSLLTADAYESWPALNKKAVAERLAATIAEYFNQQKKGKTVIARITK